MIKRMIKLLIILLKEKLGNEEIKLYDIFVLGKGGDIYIFRPSENKVITLKSLGRCVIQRVSTKEVFEKGNQILQALAEKAAKEKGCIAKWFYDLKPDWAWAFQITFP